MAIRELIEQGATREQAIQLAVDNLGMFRAEAEFVLAVELGEIEGDVVEVSGDGQEET